MDHSPQDYDGDPFDDWGDRSPWEDIEWDPRPLGTGETPGCGDLIFERGTGWQAALIRFGTGDAINHCAVLLAVTPAGWLVAEANASGFVTCVKPAPHAFIVRPGDGDTRAVIAAEAMRLANTGLGYDAAAIVRFALQIVGRAQPLTKPGRVLLAPLTALAAIVSAIARRALPDSAGRVICSGAVRQIVEAATGVDLGKPGQAPDETSPAELFRACYGLRQW